MQAFGVNIDPADFETFQDVDSLLDEILEAMRDIALQYPLEEEDRETLEGGDLDAGELEGVILDYDILGEYEDDIEDFQALRGFLSDLNEMGGEDCEFKMEGRNDEMVDWTGMEIPKSLYNYIDMDRLWLDLSCDYTVLQLGDEQFYCR